MKHTLSELTDKYSSLSIVGMCKNAGKTTALNRLIVELNNKNTVIGLTSIGRDGEQQDIVTSTPKPSIYVHRGTMVATAEKLLQSCDVTREILQATGINTPLGEVIVFNCLSDGYVQVAGPSINSQLAEIGRNFTALGAQKVIIDGAISRKSLCSKSVTEATVLCTGASCNKNMDIVVAETDFICKLLCLKNIGNLKLISAVKAQKSKVTFINSHYENVPMESESDAAGHIKKNPNIKYMYVNGAVTNSVLRPLIMSSVKLDSITLICEDGSKILADAPMYARFLARGGRIKVENAINLTAVTINPFSAYGFHFDKAVFMEKMLEKITVPVINVEEV